MGGCHDSSTAEARKQGKHIVHMAGDTEQGREISLETKGNIRS